MIVNRQGVGHLFIETAKFGEFASAGHMDNGTCSHEEQTFIEDMGKGMGAGTVDRQGGADTDTGHHIADLADDLPAQESADIIFHGRIDDAVYGHDDAENDQNIKSGTAPDQGVDSRLGGKGAHEDGTGDGGLAVGIRQPGVQRRNGGIEHQTDHDQPGIELGIVHIELDKGEITCRLISENKTEQQDHAAEGMDQKIAVTGGQGCRRPY